MYVIKFLIMHCFCAFTYFVIKNNGNSLFLT